MKSIWQKNFPHKSLFCSARVKNSLLLSLREMSVDPATIKKIEEGYAKLQASAECKSLLKKHLTKEVMDQLKTKKTKMGATLWDVIRSGVANLDAGIGIYAPDYESYKVTSNFLRNNPLPGLRAAVRQGHRRIPWIQANRPPATDGHGRKEREGVGAA
jgi:hypothetical protein